MPKLESKNNSDTLGIVSLVLACTGLQIPGLIVGILGEKNAKRENRPHTLSRVGWILNLIFILLTALALGIFFALIPSHRNRVDDLSTKADLRNISQKLEQYHDVKGHYPATLTTPDFYDVSFYTRNRNYIYSVLPDGCAQCSSYTLEATLHYAESGSTAYQVKSKH